MTSDVEVINGHTYQVTRDDLGTIVSELCIDPVLPPTPLPLPTALAPLLGALQAGTATPIQQQQVLRALVLLILKRADLL